MKPHFIAFRSTAFYEFASISATILASNLTQFFEQGPAPDIGTTLLYEVQPMAIHTLLNGRCDRGHPRHHIVDQYESIGTREFDGVVDVHSREGVLVASIDKDEVGAIRWELFQQLRQHLCGITDEQHMTIWKLLINPFLCLQHIVVTSNVNRDDGDVGSRG